MSAHDNIIARSVIFDWFIAGSFGCMDMGYQITYVHRVTEVYTGLE